MKRNPDNSLYVFGESWDGPVKIGVTANVAGRLDQFRSKLPFVPIVLFETTHDDAFALEAHVHTVLLAHRLNGEWFDGSGFGPDGLKAAMASFRGRARMRGEPDRYSQEATVWVRDLISDAQRRTGCNADQAMSLVADETCLRRTFLWSQIYRPAVRIAAADYFAVKAAHERLPNEPDHPKGDGHHER